VRRAERPRLAAPLVLGAVALVLGGCAHEVILPERAPSTADTARVLAVFAHDHDDWHTLSASVSGNSEKGSFSGKVFIDRDARELRLYAWKLGGAIAVFDLLIKDEEMRLFVPGARKMLVQPLGASATALPMEACFTTFFRPREAVTRTAEHVDATNYTTSDDENPWIISEGHRGRTTTYWLAPRSLALSREYVHEEERAVLALVFYDWIIAADRRVWPTAMNITRDGDPPGKALSLKFDDLVFDAPLDAKKFEMRAPADTQRVGSFAELGSN
jgi:hypothetical protein